MKKTSTILIQIGIVLLGISVLTFLLWFPHFEGRNVNSTVFEVYFNDPFLAYVYFASIAFFTALYKTFKVFGYAEKNKLYSEASIKALQTIRLCAVANIGLVILGVLFLLANESDDRPPIIMMGAISILGSIAVAFTAKKFERELVAKI